MAAHKRQHVSEEAAFAHLEKQKKAALLEYLRAAFACMNPKQRNAVFADAAPDPPKRAINGARLRREIAQFRADSLRHKYYAPFNVNSKNFMQIPEATSRWCDAFARFVAWASELTARGEHKKAVPCFAMLYELVDAVNRGEEIFYAEEAGTWMIPTDKKAWLKAHLTSLAATSTPEAFTAAAMPMLRWDSLQSSAAGVYDSAMAVSNAEQKACLLAAVQRKKMNAD